MEDKLDAHQNKQFLYSLQEQHEINTTNNPNKSFEDYQCEGMI
jgi:hypothetical protein